jgi:GNAT superfamily N-acetyltransferase
MASIDALDIRPIDSEQCAAVYPLSVEAGWNQNIADWRFMLQAGRAFGCVGGNGRWEASSLVLPLGEKLAWISMVLVTKARRREGLGTTLLRRCIEEARAAGRVAGLDATEQGRPIYLPLGFRDLYRISRWHFDGVMRSAVPSRSTISLRPVVPSDLPELALYDRPRSAMERAGMLAHLAFRQPARAWIAQQASGTIAGFILGREGRAATSLGPVVADNEAIAIALVAKSAAAAEGPFIVDVPQVHLKLRAWLEAQGATTPRGYIRMTLGEVPGLDDPRRLFALAGPELG